MHSATKKLAYYRPTFRRSSRKTLKKNDVHFPCGANLPCCHLSHSAHFLGSCCFMGSSPWLGDREEKPGADNRQRQATMVWERPLGWPWRGVKERNLPSGQTFKYIFWSTLPMRSWLPPLAGLLALRRQNQRIDDVENMCVSHWWWL